MEILLAFILIYQINACPTFSSSSSTTTIPAGITTIPASNTNNNCAQIYETTNVPHTVKCNF